MTLENLLSQIGTGTKLLTERYSGYPEPVHDHHVYYTYEPSAPAHGHIAASKHNYGGGHKSNASMSALTLLAFLFFLHILQQCIKDHMMEISSTQPVMVMTGARDGDEDISKAVAAKIDKTGVTAIDHELIIANEKMDTNKQNKKSPDPKNPYDYDDSLDKKQLLKVYTHTTKSDNQKYPYVFNNNANHSSYFAGFVSAMDEE